MTIATVEEIIETLEQIEKDYWLEQGIEDLDILNLVQQSKLRWQQKTARKFITELREAFESGNVYRGQAYMLLEEVAKRYLNE